MLDTHVAPTRHAATVVSPQGGQISSPSRLRVTRRQTTHDVSPLLDTASFIVSSPVDIDHAICPLSRDRPAAMCHG